MRTTMTRRSMLAAGASLVALGAAGAAKAQAKPKLRFTTVATEQDIRAEAFKAFGEAIKDRYDFEPYFNGTLFKQGTELVAMQRGNVEMANLSPQDISKQIPAWSLLTAAYLFRDADHLQKTFAGPIGAEFKKMVKDQLGVADPDAGLFRHAPGQPALDEEDQHAGRHGGHQAAHAAGRGLAAPGRGDGRQPDAGGLRRALHRAAGRRRRRPGQPAADQPDDEVPRGDQAVRADQPPRRLRPASRSRPRSGTRCRPRSSRRSRPRPTRPSPSSTAKHLAQEKEMVDFFKAQGLEVYSPNVAAFRESAQKKYLASRPLPRTGRRACSSASTRSSKRLPPEPAGPAGPAGVFVCRELNEPDSAHNRTMAAAARREHRRPAAGDHVHRLHRPDRPSLRLQLAGRLDVRADHPVLGVGRAVGCGLRRR